MTAKRRLVVVNPHGGTRRGLAILEQARPVFERAGMELSVRVTECRDHAREIARTSGPDHCDSLCVIGGEDRP